MDWSEFWIEHGGRRTSAEHFGSSFLPELLRVIETHVPQGKSFLEWGSGLSTMLLSSVAAPRGGRVISIEHDQGYAQAVNLRLAPGAPVEFLTPDLTGPKRSQADAGLNYSTWPLSLSGDFDFMLIDGRRRVECAFTAFIRATPATVVAMHDYRRARYWPVSVLFETLEAGEQFRVMRGRAELLRLTASERASLLRDVKSAGN